VQKESVEFKMGLGSTLVPSLSPWRERVRACSVLDTGVRGK